MRRPLIIAATALVLSLGIVVSVIVVPAGAGQSAPAEVANVETRTFAVENMTCAFCPVTVKKAMEGVEGVRSVEVDFDAKTATVAFDGSVTTAEAIAAASTDSGYPAHPAG